VLAEAGIHLEFNAKSFDHPALLAIHCQLLRLKVLFLPL